MNSVRLRKSTGVATVTLLALASNQVLFAQGEAAAAGGSVVHLAGAALGVGLIVIGAGLGIGRFAAAAAEGIARQPAAAAQITGAINLPLFLLEGVAIIAEVVVLLIVLLNGRPVG
jgi:F-type H+-transporting ATPase subunit c